MRKMSKQWHKLLSLLLVAIMMISAMPMSAIAVTNTDGYIKVRTVEDLYSIRYDLTANYILMNDIDLTNATAVGGEWDFNGNGWNPIGSSDVYGSTEFSGIFDGGGYSIIGMRIDLSNSYEGIGSERCIGLFSNVTGSICNLNLKNVNINYKHSEANGQTITGAITAKANNAQIANCSVSGLITNESYNMNNDIHNITGGLIGTADNCIINNCKNTANVSGGYTVGGIVGNASGESKIDSSYNAGSVTADIAKGRLYTLKSIGSGYYGTQYKYTYTSIVSGIANGSNSVKITNCYNSGDVIGISKDDQTPSYPSSNYIYDANVYGISNETNIELCYNIGQLSTKDVKYALGYGTVINSYYLSGMGQSSTGATPLTESQMKKQSMYSNFDFENIWETDPNAIYPYPQLKNNIQDNRILEKGQIAILPYKIIYSKGEEFEVDGLTLKFEFENAEDEYVMAMTDEVVGYDSNTLGIQTLSVTHYGKTFSFNVTVNEKPFNEIKTIEDLYNIRLDLSANYILMNDIDLTEATAVGGDWDYDGKGWNPIGSNDIYDDIAFSGIFDGNGYSIIGMRINLTSANVPSGAGSNTYAGLFTNIIGEVRNLNIKNVNIESVYASDDSYVGAISACNNGTITNCAVSGTISAAKGYYAGGITGNNKGTVDKCYNIADVVGYRYVGGISGYNSSNIENCYNTGSITYKYAYNNSSGSHGNSGGISGYNTSYIAKCYNTGNTVGQYSDTLYSIATGYKYTVTDCYYLADTGKGVTGATSLSDEQMKLQSMFTGFDFEDTWVVNAYANHPYPQLKSNIQDLNETVELIRVIAYPAKMDYLTGDKLNLVGGLFEAVYISGKTDLLSITDEMVSGYNPETTGVQTLTVTYGGQTDTFNINVTQRPLATNVTVVSEPTQTSFVIGTAFDFSGAKVKVEYDNNTSETIDVTLDMTTGADINDIGTQIVTIEIDGCSDSFEIEVVPASISSIKLIALPTKLTYIEGEKLDLAGMTVVAVYSDGREITIADGYTWSGYLSTVGTHTVTIDFAGKTADFDVTVTEKKVNNIQIQQKPNKLNYIVGEELDLTGLVVVAAYETTEVKVIEDYTVSELDGTAGTKVITVTYKGKSAAFTVNVEVIAVEALIIKQMPVKLNYIENEPLDTQGLIVEATYNNGDVKTVDASEYDLVGFSSLPGTHTIHIAFGGKVATYQITVSPKVLSDVRIVQPTKKTYYIGEEFDATGMEVIACYNNGQEFAVDAYTMIGFDSLSAGAKEITITYGGLTRSFSVAVAEKSNVITNGAVKVGNLKGRLGETVVVPVSFTQSPGLSAFCHTITFDTTDLEFVSVTLAGGYTDGTLVVNDEKLADGEITVLWFKPADVVESDVAYNLTFKICETAVDGVSTINIAFDDNDNGNASGENVIFESVNGGVEVLSYWLGDLDGNRKYEMGDLLQLAQYVSGKSMVLTEKQLKSADVNEDGIIDIHDVTLLSQWLLTAPM